MNDKRIILYILNHNKRHFISDSFLSMGGYWKGKLSYIMKIFEVSIANNFLQNVFFLKSKNVCIFFLLLSEPRMY